MTEKKYSNPKITDQVQALWEDLGNIPVNENMEIQEVFGGFTVGTSAEDIWHWFEDAFDISVHELMFPGQNQDKEH